MPKKRNTGPRGRKRSKTRKRMRAEKAWGAAFERHTARGEDHGSAAYAADDAELRAWKNLPKPTR